VDTPGPKSSFDRSQALTEVKPVASRQSRYDYGRTDVPSQDDYYGNGDVYGNPRNYYGNRNARFAMGKGKGKGKSFNAKGMRNAIPKEWDADQSIGHP
jgi:hypothetical protein